MKSVKLKIEEFFGGEFSWCFEGKNKYSKLHEKINEIISSKCKEVYFNQDFNFFKPGESRESIIDAIQDFQKEKMPESCSFCRFNSSLFIVDNKHKEVSEFYNCKTRVITITDWSE